MGFKDQPFKKRWEKMGDAAEAAFLRVYPDTESRRSEPFGWDRSELNTSLMSPKMRYMPDFVTTFRTAWLTECVGFGRDRTLKFKVEKLVALEAWRGDMPVFVFVYDQPNDRWAMFDLGAFRKLCSASPVKTFPEGKEYYSIDLSDQDWFYPVRAYD